MSLTEQDIRWIMAEEFESVLKRVFSMPDISLVASDPPPVVVVGRDTGNPYLMSDDELRFAERLLPADERPILRLRVMAARLDARGQRAQGDRQRKKADRMEQNLSKKAA